MLQAVRQSDVLDEVGRVREADLVGAMVQPLEAGRPRDEVDAVAAEVGVRVPVAVVQPERTGGGRDGRLDDRPREEHPVAGRVGREPGLDEPPLHLRAAHLHAGRGQHAEGLVEDPVDELGRQDGQAWSHLDGNATVPARRDAASVARWNGTTISGMTAEPHAHRAADLLVECLVAEGCEFVFSVPGEETMDILDALSERPQVRHITTRHEQGAAFMADVHGRLTGRAAVAMGTLGPGATNLVTGVADAFLDRAPMVAITGQAASAKLHKEAHQVVDIVRMMEPVTKWNTRVERIEAIPEIVRKAFRVATLEKPGPTHIELPEDLAATAIPTVEDGGPAPLEPGKTYFPEPTDEAIAHAAGLLAASERPIILAGNGVLRRSASAELRALARGLHVPVAATFMGKGAIDDRSHLSLMAVGLQARDHVLSGFDRADLVVCVGYDLVEYAPSSWNADGSKRIIHIDTQPAEIDAAYQPEVELVGDIDGTLRRLLVRGPAARHRRPRCRRATREPGDPRPRRPAHGAACASCETHAANDAWPITPQRAIADLRRALAPDDIVVSDVGAHKVWVARLYQAYEPNTVIISNGFAAMGIAIPGAIAAALVHPDRKVVALCGDGGFLMNSQELETATRVGANITVVIWRDDGYGLIDWKQRNEFGRPFGVEFGNPDFVAYARVLRDARLPPGIGRRPVPDALSSARARGSVAGRGAHRLRREPAPDRAPGGAVGVGMNRSIRVALLALGLALGWTVAPAPPPGSPAAVAAAEAWDGSVDLYRKGVFTTQKTWLWCTAAGVQIVRNIVEGEADHARASQSTLLRLDARPQSIRPARVGGRGSGRLDRRASALRRRPLSTGGQPLVRGRPALGGHRTCAGRGCRSR